MIITNAEKIKDTLIWLVVIFLVIIALSFLSFLNFHTYPILIAVNTFLIPTFLSYKWFDVKPYFLKIILMMLITLVIQGAIYINLALSTVITTRLTHARLGIPIEKKFSYFDSVFYLLMNPDWSWLVIIRALFVINLIIAPLWFAFITFVIAWNKKVNS